MSRWTVQNWSGFIVVVRICRIMGIGRTVQWAKHFTTAQLAECFGMRESIGHLLGQCRLDG